MKNPVNILLIIGFCSLLLSTHDVEAQKKPVPYQIWVKKYEAESKYFGLYNSINDSLLYYANPTESIKSIPIKQIESIKLRRKGKIGKGIGLGALVGFGIGAILGLIDGDDEEGWISYSAEEKALMGGTVLSIPGALLGGVNNINRKRIDVNGKPVNLQRHFSR